MNEDDDVMAEIRSLVDQLYELVDELRDRLDQMAGGVPDGG